MLHTFSIPRSTTRLYHGSGQIVENDSLVMTRFAGGFLDGGGNARYYMTDYQGNNIAAPCPTAAPSKAQLLHSFFKSLRQ